MDEREKRYYGNDGEDGLQNSFEETTMDIMLKELADALDISFILMDYRGQILAKELRHDTYCAERRESAAACVECDKNAAFAAAKAAIQNHPYLFRCPYNLVSMAIPVIVNNQYMGAVIGGRVRSYDSGKYPLISEIRNEDFFKEEQQMASYREIQEFSEQRFFSASRLVRFFIKKMEENEIYQREEVSEKRREKHLQELRQSNMDLKKKLLLAEQNALQAKIHPQQLLNYLITISNFAILENAQETEEIIAELSSVCRYYIDNKKDIVFLSEEIDQIEKYLHILKKQCDYRLDYVINCDEDAGRWSVPMLSVFPFVCYIANDGILPGHFAGEIQISAAAEKETLDIEIILKNQEYMLSGNKRNLPPFFDDNFLKLQMENTRKRLEYHYGSDCVTYMDTHRIQLSLPE